MPKQTITAAIVDYLAPENSNITNLSTVYAALPKVGRESDWYDLLPAGSGVGAVIFCFVESYFEYRSALGGPHAGHKFREYTMALLCMMKSTLETAEEGQAQFDAFCDSLTAAIQINRTANAPNVVFQWGEGNIDGRSPDLRFEFAVPKTINGQEMLYEGTLRVIVCEDFSST